MTHEQEKLIVDNIRLARYITYEKLGAVLKSAGIDPEDAVQQALARLCEVIANFDPQKGQYTTWAGQVIRNVALGLVRQSKKRWHNRSIIVDSLSKPVYRDGDGNVLLLQDTIPITDERLSRLDTTDIELLMHNAKLSAKECLLIKLSIEGLNQREMSARTGISQSYVSRLMKKAKQRLHTQYNKLYG